MIGKWHLGHAKKSYSRRNLNHDGINLAPYLTKIRPSSDIANRGMFMNYDIFMNVSIYRKGDYKLILGSPGPPVIFEEPTSSVFHNVNYPHLFGFILKDNIMEYLTDLYTTYINPSPPFALIFLGYSQIFNRMLLFDWFTGMNVRNFLQPTSQGTGSRVKAELEVPCLKARPAFLYDLKNDQSEEFNLAEKRPELVEEIYNFMVSDFEDGKRRLVDGKLGYPMQIAGDAIDLRAPMNSMCSFYQEEDFDVMEADWINERLFVRLPVRILAVVWCGVAAFWVCLFVLCLKIKNKTTKLKIE